MTEPCALLPNLADAAIEDFFSVIERWSSTAELMESASWGTLLHNLSKQLWSAHTALYCRVTTEQWNHSNRCRACVNVIRWIWQESEHNYLFPGLCAYLCAGIVEFKLAGSGKLSLSCWLRSIGSKRMHFPIVSFISSTLIWTHSSFKYSEFILTHYLVWAEAQLSCSHNRHHWLFL